MTPGEPTPAAPPAPLPTPPVSRLPIAWFVLIATLLLTVGAWRQSVWDTRRREEAIFDRQIQLITAAIRQRMDAYETVLRAAGALLAGPGAVGRREWSRFVGELGLASRYPGIQVLEAGERVPGAGLQQHVEAIRTEGFPDYHVHPAGERPEYFPVLYVEPMAANQAAFGYDLLSEPIRRAAAERARDTGLAAVSGRVQLIQDADATARPAFLMFYPYYGELPSSPSLAARQAALRGFVVAAFRMAELMAGVLPYRRAGIDFTVLDGGPGDPGTLLYDDDAVVASTPAQFEATVPLELGGHTWMLRFASGPAFEHSLARGEPFRVLFAGLLVSALLFAIVWTQGMAERRALALATQMTARAREREARLQAIVNSEPECVKVVGIDGCLLEMNPAGLAMVEAEQAEEVVGHLVLDLIHPEDRAAYRQLHERVAAGDSGSLSFRFVGLRGGLHWMETSSVPLREERGEITAVLSVTRDVTARKAVEDAYRQTQSLVASIVEHSPSVVFVKDARDLRYVLVNRAGDELLGYPGQVMLGKTDHDVFSQKEADAFTAKDRDVLTSGRIVEIPEETLQTAHRGVRYMRTVKVPILDDDGQPKYLLGISEDITERRALEEQLRQAQKMEALGTLAGGIAHDFNNILTSIIGFGELAHHDAAGNAQVLDGLANVLEAGHRAKDLVEQLNAFSRQHPFAREPLDPGAIIGTAIKVVRAALPASVVIRTEIGTDLPRIPADATQMHQLVMNLASNGAQAMPEGGLLEIEVGLSAGRAELPPGSYVRLLVRDAGIGMGGETLARMFEPFFTTKPPGQGTGLGLAVAHGIVKSHDGAIFAQSQQGKGTTVEVYLPEWHGEDSEAPVVEPAVPQGHGEHILFVDDERQLAELGRRQLESLGYRVTALTDPMEAMAVFRARPARFDLVVADLTMPGLGGAALAQALLDVRPGIPILLNTGNGAHLTAEGARALGARGLLAKPHTVGMLGHAVHQALAGGT